MSIVLLRLDERLIHGQVVVGWGVPLHADRVTVVDDTLAESPWEQELYSLGVPPEMEADFATVHEARERFPSWRADQRRRMVLFRDVSTLASLADVLLTRDGEVNLGGLHHTPGRTEALAFLFLNPRERRELQALADRGLKLTAQDLPGGRRVPLAEVLASH